MPSTYSDNLKIELIGTGEQSGTWGSTTNSNLGTLIEEAICGVGSVVIPNADTTITIADGASSEARKIVLEVTGALTANRNLIVPTIDKTYLIHNNTSGGYSIVVKTAAGSGVTVKNGQKRFVYVNSTNVVEAISSVGDFYINGNGSVTGSMDVTGTFSVNGTSYPGTSTGTGALVLANSPALVTPNLGTPSSVNLTNATGLSLTSGVTGTLPVANGGTGQTTATNAFNALAPTQTGNSGKFLTTDGVTVSWAAPTAAASSVSVGTTSVLSATNGAILYNNLGTLGATSAVPVTAGGTGQTTAAAAFAALNPMTATGDLIYGTGGGGATRLSVGTSGQVLGSNGSTPSWITPINNITTSSSVSGLTFTGGGTSGTINLAIGGSLSVNANSLTGTTLNSGVTSSSLTSLGTLSSLSVSGAGSFGSISSTGSATLSTAGATFPGTSTFDTGGLKLGTTASAPGYANSTIGFAVSLDVTNGPGAFISRREFVNLVLNNNTAGSVVEFYKSGASVGSIQVSGSATSFIGTSDYRLKENVEPLTNALSRLQNLNVYRFNWKLDPAGPKVDGFIAHEVAPVVPEAVAGEKDAVTADGKIKPQGIDQSKLVPLLTAALQEANAKIEALTARVEALENK